MNINILFTSYEERKLEKDIDICSKKVLKKIQKEIKITDIYKDMAYNAISFI